MSNSTIDGKKGRIILKEGCNIGANSVIFPNVIIGKNGVEKVVEVKLSDKEKEQFNL